MSKQDTVGSHKTLVYTDDDGALCVRYHNTVVWKRLKDGRVILNNGGWHTRTTMLRMCQAFWQFADGKFYVCQRKGKWFVGSRPDHTLIPYENDMVVQP